MPSPLEKKAAQLEAQLAVQSKNFASVLSDLQEKSVELEQLRKFVQREVAAREKAELRWTEAEALTKKALKEAREAETLLEQANEKHDGEVREMASLLGQLQQQWALKKQQYARLSTELERRGSGVGMVNGAAPGAVATGVPTDVAHDLAERAASAEQQTVQANAREQMALAELEQARTAAAEIAAAAAERESNLRMELDAAKAAAALEIEAAKTAAADEMSALRTSVTESKLAAAAAASVTVVSEDAAALPSAADGEGGFGTGELDALKAAHAAALEAAAAQMKSEHAVAIGALEEKLLSATNELRQLQVWCGRGRGPAHSVPCRASLIFIHSLAPPPHSPSLTLTHRHSPTLTHPPAPAHPHRQPSRASALPHSS